VCYTTVYRGINSLTLTYTTRDSCITYIYVPAAYFSALRLPLIEELSKIMN